MSAFAPVTAKYDPEAGAIYVSLSAMGVASTLEADGIIVDLDSAGEPSGLEFTGPRSAAEIGRVLERYELLGKLGAIEAAIEAAIELPTSSAPNLFTLKITPADYVVTGASPGSISLGVPPRDLEPA